MLQNISTSIFTSVTIQNFYSFSAMTLEDTTSTITGDQQQKPTVAVHIHQNTHLKIVPANTIKRKNSLHFVPAAIFTWPIPISNLLGKASL